MLTEELVLYKDNKEFHIIRRAGPDCFSHPKTDNPPIDSYDETEVVFYTRDGINSRKIYERLSFWIKECKIVLDYKTSNDGIPCANNVNRAGYRQIVKTLKDEGYSDKVIVVPENKKTNLKTCRVCGDQNDLYGPDDIVDDGMFTCYVCGTHPSKYMIGLITKEQISNMRNKYRGKGFMS